MSAKFAKLAAASAALLVAAACGGGSGEKKSDAAPPPDPAQLKVWMMGTGSPEQTEFLDGVEAEFKAKHPKTDVKVEYVPWPNAAQKFQTALAGGKGPDVTEVGNTDVQTWIDQDAFADITENMNAWAEGKSLNKTAIANDQRDGKTYAMPWYGGVRGVWYRTDWFEDLGIQTPKTWADLTAAAKKIQDEKNVPGIAAPSDFTNGIASLIWGNGGEIAVQEGGKWVGKLDQPAAKEAITFYTGLVTTDKVAPAKYAGKNELQGPQTDFALGKVGMYMDGSWSLPQMEKISKKNKDKWGVFPIPSKAGGNAPVFAGGSDLAVWKDSQAPDAAFDYLTVLNSKKNGGAWADISKFNSQFTDVKFSDPKLAVFTEIASNAKFLPLTSGWAEVEGNKKVIPTAVKAIMQGKSADAEIAKANTSLNELLNAS